MKSFGEALSDKRLKDSTFRLYCCIWKAMEINNRPFVKTNKEITEYTGMSESTITRALNQLIDLDYVNVSKGQKVSVDGQIRILNDNPYRTIEVTDNIETKKTKKELNWKEDEKFVSFFNRYREAVKSQGRPMNTNQKNAYKLYVKVKNKRELINNTNEYTRQMRETNTYLKDLSTWLNTKNELWINDEYSGKQRTYNENVDYYFYTLKTLWYKVNGSHCNTRELQDLVEKLVQAKDIEKLEYYVEKWEKKLAQVK